MDLEEVKKWAKVWKESAKLNRYAYKIEKCSLYFWLDKHHEMCKERDKYRLKYTKTKQLLEQFLDEVLDGSWSWSEITDRTVVIRIDLQEIDKD